MAIELYEYKQELNEFLQKNRCCVGTENNIVNLRELINTQ